MRIMLSALMTTAMLGGAAAAQDLDGLQIHVHGGDDPLRHIPISLPWDGGAPAGDISVVHAATGEALPATLRDGELTFIVAEVPAGETVAYRVAVNATARLPLVRLEPAPTAGQPEAEEDPGDYSPTEVDPDPAIEVAIAGDLFTVYRHSNKNRKPFLYPVMSAGQVPITRTWPMEAAEDEKDHPHHKSLWTAYGEVTLLNSDTEKADLWAETTGNAGWQHTETVDFASGDAYGVLRAENVWQDEDHTPLIDETREYRFYATPAEARLFDLVVTLTASYGDVLLSDTKEGGMFAMRVRDAIRADRNGVITIADGRQGEGAVWGQASPWLDYSGTIEGAGERGIAIFDHPDNPRHPTRWHARDYGLVGANVFGLSYFLGDDHNGDMELAEGESVTFRYRCYIHTGGVEDANVAAKYAQYATPPRAEWVE